MCDLFRLQSLLRCTSPNLSLLIFPISSNEIKKSFHRRLQLSWEYAAGRESFFSFLSSSFFFFFVGFHAFVRVAYFAFTRTLLIGTLISPLRAVFLSRASRQVCHLCTVRSKWEKKKVRLSRWLIHLSCRLIAPVISKNEKSSLFFSHSLLRAGRLLASSDKDRPPCTSENGWRSGSIYFFSFNFNNFLRSTL